MESAINASDVTISGQEDDLVRLFDLSRNRNVEFLPNRVGQKFPNLVSYIADRCAIREISTANFEYLFHLRILDLNGNRLESLNTDSFKDLVSLESLFLAGNKIKTLEGGGLSWRQFNSVKHWNFMFNTCLNETYHNIEPLVNIKTTNCEKSEPALTEVKPTCQVINKCSLGQRCCFLSKFKSSSSLVLQRLEKGDDNQEFDAVSYNSNPNVQYLLEAFANWAFWPLKVYDASNCAIREIFLENFDFFYDIESINLANNQISAVSSFLIEIPLKHLNLCNYLFVSSFPLF